MLDVSVETISKWENDNTEPTEDNVEKLVDIFGDQLGVEYLKSKSKIAKRCLSGISYKPNTPREVAYLQSMTVNKCEQTAKILSNIMLNEKIDDDEVEPTYNCIKMLLSNLSSDSAFKKKIELRFMDLNGYHGKSLTDLTKAKASVQLPVELSEGELRQREEFEGLWGNI